MEKLPDRGACTKRERLAESRKVGGSGYDDLQLCADRSVGPLIGVLAAQHVETKSTSGVGLQLGSLA